MCQTGNRICYCFDARLSSPDLAIREETKGRILKFCAHSYVHVQVHDRDTTMRNVHRLQKMWTNMEGNQRDALTKEKQAHLATGGGPTVTPVHADPDIAFILPNMLRVAPIIFSSNISEEVINERRKAVFNNSSIFEKTLRDCNDDCPQADNSFGAGASHINEMFIDPISVTENCDNVTAKRSLYTGSVDNVLNDIVTVPKKKTKTVQLQNVDESIEMKLKLERIRRLIKQEGELADLKLQHEKVKQKMEIEYLRKKCEVELRAAAAAAELSVVLFKKNNV